jgi:hypothetical protein
MQSAVVEPKEFTFQINIYFRNVLMIIILGVHPVFSEVYQEIKCVFNRNGQQSVKKFASSNSNQLALGQDHSAWQQ